MIADHDPEALYREAFKRDRGRCSDCGLDCVRLRQQMTRAISDVNGGTTWEGVRAFGARLDQLEAQGYPRGAVLGGFRFWILVLVVPRDEGGSPSLENTQTKCLQCFAATLAERARKGPADFKPAAPVGRHRRRFDAGGSRHG